MEYGSPTAPSPIGGWFKELATPGGRRQLQDSISSGAVGLNPKSILQYIVGPLALGFFVFQTYLATYAMRVLSTNDNSAVPLGVAMVDAELAKAINRVSSTNTSVGRELGYVQVAIPQEIANFLNQAEALGGGSEPEWMEALQRRPMVESEKLSVRLSPVRALGPKVTPKMPDPPQYSESERFALTWEYNLDEKLPPYVGNEFWLRQFPKGSRHYLNSLATFPFASNEGPIHRQHGHVGVYPNGTQAWNSSEMPPPVEEAPGGRKEAMSRGGFYLALSNALPLDREPDDTRDEICKTITYDYTKFKDVSVIITFYNEPLSTLLRSVHSVLNNTPPPILREVILVDDHSNLTENMPGSELYDYLQLLPKVKLMRLPERRGLVWARLAGAQAAKAPVLVVLDSHVEMNYYWLEPQLQRLLESPKSIVFPQIMALNADKFTYNKHAGIGCWLSWKWNMVERSTLTGKIDKPDAIASPSMAGGLFAVNADWFWEIGGYDEDFAMWGSENVEMGFRTWMCGGRLECAPCSRTYHIYRDGGMGYTSPAAAVWKNKIRTARVWLDEWYPIASKFIGHSVTDIGNFDHVNLLISTRLCQQLLELKKRLKCKPFSWFLENVDPGHDARRLNDVHIFGAVKNKKFDNRCLDTMGHLKQNETYGIFHCHGGGGSQGFYKDKSTGQIKSFNDDTKCLTNDEGRPVFWTCSHKERTDVWTYDGQLKYMSGKEKESCLTVSENGTRVINISRPYIQLDQQFLLFTPCDPNDDSQRWDAEAFEPDPDFALPDFSLEYKKLRGMV